MSGFSRGVADGMLLNDLASAESAASSARRDADSARDELRRYQEWAESEIASWRKLSDEIKGQRDGFQALLMGFHRAIKDEIGEGEGLDSHFGKAIRIAREYLLNPAEFPEKQAKNALSSWANEKLHAWNSKFCLAPILAPGPVPAMPAPPCIVTTVHKSWFFAPTPRYTVEGVTHKKQKRADEAFAAALKRYEDVILPSWEAAKKRHETYVASYENQQGNLAKYGLST